MKQTFLLVALCLSGALCSAQTPYPLSEYNELTDPRPPVDEGHWSKVPATPPLRWGSTDIRYTKHDVPAISHLPIWKATAWKGERVNAQAVLWTRNFHNNVELEVSELRNGSSVIPAEAVQSAFVRYVMTDELNKDGKGGCGQRPNKAEWDSSLVADVLDPAARLSIDACTTQPIWLTISIPSDARPGVYKGTLTVSADDMTAQELPFEINVLDRTLPSAKDWAFHLDLWQNPYAVARYYQVPLWSQAHFDAMRPAMKLLADAGQKVITASIMHKPWNGQTEDAFDSMIAKTKKIDGTWSYDYTVFDKWVEFMMNEIGIDRQINCYTMIPWALRFDYFDQATGRILFIEAKPGEPAYNEYWGAFLKDFAAHLRAKGWFEKTTIAMDERGLDAMQEAIKVIRKADPDYKISLAGNYHSEIEHELHDLCLAYTHTFPDEVKAARQKAGKVSTVYTCCAEARPNTFTFSPPYEATWIGWHVMAGNYDGYLRWAYNSWTADPLRDSRFRSWAAGDCYLIYPGARSSIRMERLIEGIQDAEKIRLLREEFTRKKANGKLRKLNRIVSEFSSEGMLRPDPATRLKNAREALNRF